MFVFYVSLFNSHKLYLKYHMTVFLQDLVSCSKSSVTCFIRSDGELVARVAVADDVLGNHSDIVSGGRVEVDNRGLVELR